MAYQTGEAEFRAHIIMHMRHMCIAIIMKLRRMLRIRT
jgi:hypothetical protein